MGGRYETRDWYSTPDWYDIIYDHDTALEVDFLEQVLAQHGSARRRPRGAPRRVLEPACGSGRLMQEFARRGYAVAGFDLSEEMVEYTRRRLSKAGHDALVTCASLQRFSLGRGYDLAHCLVSTFKYILDEQEAREHLRLVAKALRPGGLYVLGVHLTDYGVTRYQRERWVGARRGVEVTCNVQTWPPDRIARTERVRSRLRVTARGRERRSETEWLFRTYDQREMLALLAGMAPTLELVGCYDFTYDIEQPLHASELEFDSVFVLRRG